MKWKSALTTPGLSTVMLFAVAIYAQDFTASGMPDKERFLRLNLKEQIPPGFFEHELFPAQDPSRPWHLPLSGSDGLNAGKLPFSNFLFDRERHRNVRAFQPANAASPLHRVDSVQTEWARQYASALAPGYDFATAITVDNAGNVYVAGYSSNLPFGVDYLAAKYSAAGVELWTARYNGEGKGNDLPSAIKVDAGGNVYVTGASIGLGTRWDYTTIKYNAAGIQQWVARYNGPGNSDDYATALGVDASGNVYVAGQSAADSTYVQDSSYNDDYAIVKYNASGAQQWVARYNGTANSTDQATALALDGVGNIYVTGYSFGSGTFYDYVTIKYNTFGIQQWIARHNGPGNSSDFANAIGVDGSGNVYVTGSSFVSDDYATIKYNSAGVEQWVARYNGPGNDLDIATALAVDNSGNVLVTGRSWDTGTFYDYATIKYNSAGVEQWVARYNGPGNPSDFVNALAADGSGNVYVTGSSGTIKYNSSGVQQWRASSPGFTNVLAIDGSGNVHVTGPGFSSGTGNDFVTIKYNSLGAQQWVASYNGSGNSSDFATALAVDGAGNIYVTGQSFGTSTSFDYATIKYNSAGIQQWVARYNGPGNSLDVATALAVDGSGNLYVTGYSFGSGTSSDYTTIKYNSAGVEQWVARYNGPGNSSDQAAALVVDGSGNVCVTGWSNGSGTSRDYATIQYNFAGVEQWVARYNGPGNSSDEAAGLGVDGSGNVYVTGGSEGTGTSSDFATIKYNSSGIEQWVARYDGPGNDFDEATKLVVDLSDGGRSIYITGSSWGAGTSFDFATIKYSSAGVEQWVARYNSPVNDWEIPSALAVDRSGNIYVTGLSFVTWTLTDYATVKYNASGVEQWVARYNGPGDAFDQAAAIALDPAGSGKNVYVTGSSGGAGSSIYSTIKYVQTLVAVKEPEPGQPRAYWLSQNYPNPFGNAATSPLAGNPTTTIRYAIPKPGHVALRVYNFAGQEVADLVNTRKPAGEFEVQWNPLNLPSGVYVYRLQAEDFVATQKLVLLK